MRWGPHDGAPVVTRQSEYYDLLASWGVPVSPYSRVVDSLAGVEAMIAEYEGRRHAVEHQIDGIVVKVDDLALQRRLGATSRAPRWAIASSTRRRRSTRGCWTIAVDIGRTGRATPYAVMEPVFVSGGTVREATLHNAAEVVAPRACSSATWWSCARQATSSRRSSGPSPKAPDDAVTARRVAMPIDCPSCGTPAAPEKEGDVDCAARTRGPVPSQLRGGWRASAPAVGWTSRHSAW